MTPSQPEKNPSQGKTTKPSAETPAPPCIHYREHDSDSYRVWGSSFAGDQFDILAKQYMDEEILPFLDKYGIPHKFYSGDED